MLVDFFSHDGANIHITHYNNYLATLYDDIDGMKCKCRDNPTPTKHSIKKMTLSVAQPIQSVVKRERKWIRLPRPPERNIVMVT